MHIAELLTHIRWQKNLRIFVILNVLTKDDSGKWKDVPFPPFPFDKLGFITVSTTATFSPYLVLYL